MKGTGLKKGEPFPEWHGEFPRLVLTPKNDTEVERAFAFAKQERLKAVFTGLGGRLSWLKRPEGGFLLVKTSLMKDVFTFDRANLTIEAGAGMALSSLDAFLKEHGCFFPLDAFDLDALTIGGAYQTNALGGLSGSFGQIKDLVLGVELKTPAVPRVHFGAHVIKNVSGYDLRRFLAGAFGEFGMVSRMVLRVYPRPEMEARLQAVPKGMDGLGGLLGLVQQESSELTRAVFVRRVGERQPTLWAGIAGGEGLCRRKAARFKDRFVKEGIEAELGLEAQEAFSLEGFRRDRLLAGQGAEMPCCLAGFGLDATLEVIRALEGAMGVEYLLYPRLGRAFLWESTKGGAATGGLEGLEGLHGIKIRPLPFGGVVRGPAEKGGAGAILSRIRRVFDPEGLIGTGLFS